MREILEAAAACQYTTASSKLLKRMQQVGTPERDTWAVALLLGRLRSLGSPVEAPGKLFLDLQRLFPGRAADLRIAKQLALLYYQVDHGGNRRDLLELINEIETLDRQLDGRFRAGVLCAQACLLESAGDLVSAVDCLERAWSRSETFAGLCEVEIATSMLSSLVRLGRNDDARAWASAIRELSNQGLCCRLREDTAALTFWNSAEIPRSQVDVSRLFTQLESIESPGLVAACCAPLLRSVALARWPRDVTIEIQSHCDSLITRVGPTDRWLFEYRLASLDFILAIALSDSDLLPDSESISSPETWILAAIVKFHDRLTLSADWKVQVAALGAQLDSLAKALDVRLESHYYHGLVDRRMAFVEL